MLFDVVCFPFSSLIVSIMFTIEPTNFKKSYRIWEKHDQTSINLTRLGGGYLLIPQRIFVDHVTIFIQALCKN